MKKWKQLLITFAMITGMGTLALPASYASAINVFDQCKSNGSSAVCKAQGDNAASMVKIVINTLLVVLGMIAVIMIVVGGIRYTVSHGNSSSTKEAKETIIYALVGLVVAIMSYTIVNFVVGRF